ncbi:hypothetical protein HZB78_00425 [Candidatus Collierbacteria bacterium]|nr:hypothetical protein [Candidatus Collierbacteria bacterium]
MSEIDKESEPVYPTNLDVVDFNGNEHQVIGTVRTKDPLKDKFILKDLQTGEIFRVTNGATFSFGKMRDPGQGNVYRRDEDVKVTGKIISGEIEKD